VWDIDGRRYTDTIMALGAVALGYGHEGVTEAVVRAARDGAVGPLAPQLEARVAERLVSLIDGVEAIRFFKTGAEAVLAAVRIARVHSGRSHIVTCGYHGWLDTFSTSPGVPLAVQGLRTEIPFNDLDALQTVENMDSVAAIVVEPVVDAAPHPAWIDLLMRTAANHGVVLIADEIKTGLRTGFGARHRFGLVADLTVLGKALGNGFPLAAVGGAEDLMARFTNTWISSTLATEFVSLAACDAVLDAFEMTETRTTLSARGRALFEGLQGIVSAVPELALSVHGIPEFCYIRWRDEDTSKRIARGCASRGILFKRDAYNFVSTAHTDEALGEVLRTVETVAREIAQTC
jgi:glutamate-1-semialdehyde 2,1-aminomutase